MAWHREVSGYPSFSTSTLMTSLAQHVASYTQTIYVSRNQLMPTNWIHNSIVYAEQSRDVSNQLMWRH